MSAEDPTVGVRLAEGIERSEPVNQRFAEYVQSSAFTLSLSRRMIDALVSLQHALDHQHEVRRRPLSEPGLQALERRGLIELKSNRHQLRNRRFEGEGPYLLWADVASVTTAGKLVLDLLAEAGVAPSMRSPMPPPPPGWTDPRPRINLGAGASVLPSQRSVIERVADLLTPEQREQLDSDLRAMVDARKVKL